MKTNNEKWQGNSKGKPSSGAGRDGKPFEKRDVKQILKGSRGAAKFSTAKPERDNKRPNDRPDSRNNDNTRPAFGEKKSFQLKGDRPDSGERRSFESRDGKPSFSPKKPWENRDSKPAYGERKPWENRDSRPASGDRKPWENKDSKPSFGERKPWENRDSKPAYGERKPYENREGGRPAFNGPKKPWESRDSKPKPWEDRTDSNGEKVYGRGPSESNEDEPHTGKLSFKKPGEGQKSEFIETRYDNKKDGVMYRKRSDDYDPNSKYSNKKQLEFKKTVVDLTKPIRLNKFLANAGIC